MKVKHNIPKNFIGFIVVSTLIWIFINLTKSYTEKLTYQVKFVDLPQDKVLKKDSVYTINLFVKGSGFKLISSSFLNQELKLSLKNIQQKKGINYFINTKNQEGKIQDQLQSGINLVQVEKDIMFLKVDELESKKVPLKPNIDITYLAGYNAVHVPEIKPDSVIVSGAKQFIESINEVELEKLELKDVSKNISRKLRVILPESSKTLKSSIKEAELNILVDKFTEGELEIPVRIINNNSNQKVTIFPKKVKVIFKVGLKNYTKITAQSFEVICDFKEAQDNEVNFLIPKVKLHTTFVSSVRIVPEKIDYLIQN